MPGKTEIEEFNLSILRSFFWPQYKYTVNPLLIKKKAPQQVYLFQASLRGTGGLERGVLFNLLQCNTDF